MKKSNGVVRLGSKSASQIIHQTQIAANDKILFCGTKKCYPIVKQLVKRCGNYVVITTEEMLEQSKLSVLSFDWEENGEDMSEYLPDGNGLVIVQPSPDATLMLRIYLRTWSESHYIVFCGIRLSSEMLNGMNNGYIAIADNLSRICLEPTKPADLSACADTVFISHANSDIKELIKVLPEIQWERPSRTFDISLHRDSPDMVRDSHHRKGGGLRFSRTKTEETRTVFTQSEVTELTNKGQTLIVRHGHAYTAMISG